VTTIIYNKITEVVVAYLATISPLNSSLLKNGSQEAKTDTRE